VFPISAAVTQELVFLQKQTPPAPIEGLPTHENIRGAEYYSERNLS